MLDGWSLCAQVPGPAVLDWWSISALRVVPLCLMGGPFECVCEDIGPVVVVYNVEIVVGMEPTVSRDCE